MFMLYDSGIFKGIIGMHVDDGVFGGDELFQSML